MAVFVIDASATLPWCFADEATAAYLELAMRERTPLMTLDKDLRKAAGASGVPLVGPQP
jgi:rRNA-processing protein FCF1